MATHDLFIEQTFDGKPVVEFREMVEDYFRLALSRREGDLKRRPPVAFRFEWEFIFTLTPAWRKTRWERVGEIFPEQVYIEALHPDTKHKMLGMWFKPGMTCPSWGHWSYEHGEEATKMLADLIEHFVRHPEDVFRKSRDRCCCCRKRLTDHLSKARGIGPECVKWFHPWLDRRCAAAEATAREREAYAAETGFTK